MTSNRLNKLIQIGFVLSLIANGFAAGILLSGPFLHGPPPSPTRMLYHAADKLPADARAAVLAVLDARTSALDTAMHEGASGFSEVRAALAAPTLRPDQLDAIFTRMAERHGRISAMMGDMLRDIALSIPDQHQRMAFFRNALPPGPPPGM